MTNQGQNVYWKTLLFLKATYPQYMLFIVCKCAPSQSVNEIYISGAFYLKEELFAVMLFVE